MQRALHRTLKGLCSSHQESRDRVVFPCMHSSPVFVFSWSCSLFFSCILLKNYSSYLMAFWGVWGRGRQTLNRPWIYSDTRAIGDKIMESKSFSCTCPRVGIQMSPLCCLKEHFVPLVCAAFFLKKRSFLWLHTNHVSNKACASGC